MSSKQYRGLNKLGTLWGIIITLIFFAVSSFFINGNIVGTAKMDSITDGVEILDMQRTYTVDEAYSMLDAQGEDGRQFYLTRIAPLDIVFPAAYTLFFIAMLAFIIKRLYPDKNKMMLIALVPILAGLFDYLENSMVVVMLKNYPARLESVAKAANIFTIIKWAMFPVIISLIAVGLVVLFVRFVIGQKK